MRRVYARAPLVDQFAVFGPGGFDKVAGLQRSAFAVTTYRDARLDDAEVGVEEIAGSPGEYRLTFVPHTPGVWEVEIAYAPGRQVYSEHYDVTEPVVIGGSRPPGWG